MANKQKIVVKLSINSHKKSRKALMIAVSIYLWPDTVTGEGIDSVQLTRLLRKRVGHTDLMSVGPVEEKKAEAKPTIVKEASTLQFNPYQYYYYTYDMSYYYSYQN